MTRPALQVRCPGKINWVLRILGRREDGYHELVTVFQAIDLWDLLEIRPGKRFELTCDDPSLPADSKNLVWKAAEALAEERGEPVPGAKVHLRKAIPEGGGLGGGSSDAAAALVGLAAFWGWSLPGDRLVSIGSRLGADVPFFLHGGTALGLGKGDQVEPIPFAGEKHLLLGFPPVKISTEEVYRRWAGNLTPSGIDVSLGRLRALKLPENKDFDFAVNDLEPVVFAGWGDLKRFREALMIEGAEHAMLSGSGSTVFGVFGDREGPERAARKLAGRFPGWRLRGSRTIPGAVRLIR